MRHNPTKLNVISLFAVLWSLPLNIQMHRRNVYHKCWSHYENVTENSAENSISSYQIGFFDGMAYQLAFLNERQYVELQCRDW